jgi:hypothetical protein
VLLQNEARLDGASRRLWRDSHFGGGVLAVSARGLIWEVDYQQTKDEGRKTKGQHRLMFQLLYIYPSFICLLHEALKDLQAWIGGMAVLAAE